TEIFACRGRIDWRTAMALSRFVRQNGIDVIHSHGYKSNTYALLSNFANRRFLVSTCHNWINANAKMRFYAQLDGWVLKRFDAVVPVSRSVRDQLMQAGFAASVLSVVENGIDVQRFGGTGGRSEMREEFGFEEGSFVVGTVGRLSPEKGHEVLLRT